MNVMTETVYVHIQFLIPFFFYMQETSYNPRSYDLVFCLIYPLQISSDTWYVVSCKFFTIWREKKESDKVSGCKMLSEKQKELTAN